MDSLHVIDRLKTRAQELRGLGVVSLRLFGSAARDQARPQSDIDMLVGFASPPGFDRFMDVKLLLQEALGTDVDLVTEDALRPAMRESIERDAVRVA